MPLHKTLIPLLLFSSTLFISITCIAQNRNKSRTHAVIPYNYKTLPAPPGMIYIPGGTTIVKYDQSSTDTNSSRMVSLTSFFIDKTEITNQQYRQFTEWVIDSIAIVKYLKDDKYFLEDDRKDNTTGTSAPIASTDATVLPKSNDTTATVVAPVAVDTTKTASVIPATTNSVDTSGPVVKKRINWNKVNHEKLWNTKDEETRGKLQPMLDENGNVKKEFYNFSYKYLKVVSTTNELAKNRKTKTETLNIYPDETCWAQDLTNSTVDMYVENYFKASPFDDYPVVGITWTQARAFCYWRSLNAKAYNNMPEYMKYYSLTYNLPSEAQWVYAAQGFYDMIMPSDSTEFDTTTTPKIEYPSDSTVTPHDSAWVANYIHQHQSGDTTAAQAPVVDSSKEAAKTTRNEARASRIAKKRADQRFNYYIADFLKINNKYGGKYSGPNGTTTSNAPYDPSNPPIDSSAVHFDPNGMLTNFKQDEGDYWEDGAALTLPVMSYAPNEFGLYNMEGNVSEWVLDAYSPSAFSFVSDLNPVLLYDADTSDADAMRRKVVRGGSFMSNAKSLNPFYRDMELQNVDHCFIGFRCVMQAPEIITKKVSTRNKTIRGNATKSKLYGVRVLPEIH